MKKILVLASRFPYPPIGGEKLRLFNIIKHLSRDFRVELCALYASEKEIEDAAHMSRYCDRLHLIRIPRHKRIWNALAGAWRSRPLQVSYYFDRGARRGIEAILSQGNYDGVLVHLIRMLEYCKGYPASKVVVEMTDAISMNYSRIGVPKNLWEAVYRVERKKVLRYELGVPARSSAAVLVSETDKEYLVGNGYAGRELLVIKNGTSMEKAIRPEYDANVIAFIGNMRSKQNEDMCFHFAREILPLILEKAPGARFNVVGANPSSRLLGLHDGKSVCVLGEVPNVSEAARSACLTVCPMRYGAGIQNKILESMALGVPVVTTSIGLEGIGAGPESELLVADAPADFAECALRLMRDPAFRTRIANQGAAFVDREFRWEKRMEPFLELIGRVTGLAGDDPHASGGIRPT
jgi:glycosyltransferase involved in cell wall biosynthesis